MGLLGRWGVRGVDGSCKSRDGAVAVGRRSALLCDCEAHLCQRVVTLYISLLFLFLGVRYPGYSSFGRGGGDSYFYFYL